MQRFSMLTCAVLLAMSACSSTKEETAPPRMALAPPVQQPIPTPVMEEEHGLKESQIRGVVEAEYARVRGCHTIEFSGQSDAVGSIMVDLSVHSDGKVLSAEIAESSFESGALHDCVLEITRTLSFPKARANTEFSWVYKFRD